MVNIKKIKLVILIVSFISLQEIFLLKSHATSILKNGNIYGFTNFMKRKGNPYYNQHLLTLYKDTYKVCVPRNINYKSNKILKASFEKRYSDQIPVFQKLNSQIILKLIDKYNPALGHPILIL